MITGKKSLNGDILYTYLKKHYCPDCSTKMSRMKCSKVVNSKSSEAKNYDFELGNVFLSGDVEFTWVEFQCPKCYRQISINEMKRIEKECP